MRTIGETVDSVLTSRDGAVQIRRSDRDVRTESTVSPMVRM